MRYAFRLSIVGISIKSEWILCTFLAHTATFFVVVTDGVRYYNKITGSITTCGKEQVIMKRNFTKRLSVYMLAAFLVTIMAVFALQTIVSQRNNTASGLAKLEDVKAKLAGNEANIENLIKK